MTQAHHRPQGERRSALGQAIGHTRFVVLVPVIAVLLVAFSLFLLGAVQAVAGVWQAWAGMLRGQAEVQEMSVTVLKTVSVILEAVVFFLVGVGLYSLFVAPLNLAVALGVETLNDLEERIISVIIAVMAATFLEHFIQWREPLETLQFGAALAVTVGSLVLFLLYSHRAKEVRCRKSPTLRSARSGTCSSATRSSTISGRARGKSVDILRSPRVACGAVRGA